MKNNNKIIIVILSVLILVIAVSGCISFSKEGKTNSTYDGKEVSFVILLIIMLLKLMGTVHYYL